MFDQLIRVLERGWIIFRNIRRFWPLGFLMLLTTALIFGSSEMPSDAPMPTQFATLLLFIMILCIRFMALICLALVTFFEFQKMALPPSAIYLRARHTLPKVLVTWALVNIFLTFIFFIIFSPVLVLSSRNGVSPAFVMSLLGAICIYVPISIIAFYAEKLAYFFVIFSDLTTFSALEQSYVLFKKHVGRMLLLSLALGIVATAIVVLLVWAATILYAGLFFILPLLSTSLPPVWAFGAWFFPAIFIALAAIAFGSFFYAYGMSAWVVFFFDISAQKRPPIETEERAVSRELEHSSPASEKA